jgi:hypothetical protein
MTEHVNDIRELASLLKSSAPYKSKIAETVREEFVSSVVFKDNKIVGMKYILLSDRLTHEEFLNFLTSVGIQHTVFDGSTPKKTGCGKDYITTKEGCKYALGQYCACKKDEP